MTIRKENRIKLPLTVNGKCFFVLQNGKTALHHCANNLDTDNTDALLSHGAQPNPIDKVSNLAKVGSSCQISILVFLSPFLFNWRFLFLYYVFFCRMVRLLYTLPPRKTRWKSLRCWPLMAPCWITRMQ